MRHPEQYFAPLLYGACSITVPSPVVDSSIRDKLKQYGVKGETYEDIIVKLMKFYDASGKGPKK